MFILINLNLEQGLVVHVCNPNTWKAETGGYQVREHPGLHNEFQPSLKKSFNLFCFEPVNRCIFLRDCNDGFVLLGFLNRLNRKYINFYLYPGTKISLYTYVLGSFQDSHPFFSELHRGLLGTPKEPSICPIVHPTASCLLEVYYSHLQVLTSLVGGL